MFSFLSNVLEPFAYFILVLALLMQVMRDDSIKLKVLLVHYLLCTLLMSYAAWEAFQQHDNTWAYNVLWVQSALVISYYFHQLFRSKRKKFAIKCLMLINSFYFILNDLVYGHMYAFDSLGYSFLSLTVSVLAFMYFYEALTHVTEHAIWCDFNFWLVTGYLVYFLVSFAIFLTYHQLTNKILPTYTAEERRLLTLLWGVQNGLLFLSAITTLSGYLWTSFRNRSF